MNDTSNNWPFPKKLIVLDPIKTEAELAKIYARVDKEQKKAYTEKVLEEAEDALW